MMRTVIENDDGRLPAGQYLLTVLDDGSALLAWRKDKFSTWRAPVRVDAPMTGGEDVRTCPRCGGLADRARHDEGFPRPGAISRWDNETEICSSCGTTEAVLQWSFGRVDPDGPNPLDPRGPNPWVRPPKAKVS